MSAVSKGAWNVNCSFNKGDLLASRDRLVSAVWRGFAKSVYAGVKRLQTFTMVDPKLGVDPFL